VRGPDQEYQRFDNRDNARLYAKIRKNNASYKQAGRAYMLHFFPNTIFHDK